MDYNKTINLPKTDFPMRAGLPKREPDMLQAMYDHDLYHKMVARNEGKPKFVLHDGPPYANGNIHIGTALNKILKDMIVKHKNMTGHCAPYVPGWDTHGLPIESAVLKDKKVKRDEMTTAQFRTKCREYAEGYIAKMTGQFQRLGVLGEWENPYITLLPEFEARQIEVFGKMAEKGLIYKGMKPVYWCPADQTALAEAEIEYADDPCTTIFVKFPVLDDKGKLGGLTDLSRTYFVIWTTTPWTIPGNYAICLNAEFDYVLLQVPGGDVYVLAKDLAESVCKAAHIDYAACTVLATLKGSEFELMSAKHPLFDRESVILNGEHVTLDAGSGCVHTAPGFGAEDFAICRQYDKAGPHRRARAGERQGRHDRRALQRPVLRQGQRHGGGGSGARGLPGGQGEHHPLLPPLLALQEPHHLPGHRAVVLLRGRHQGRRGEVLRRHPVEARVGQGAHDLHDHRALRLVHLPPAGVGRAHPHLLLRRLRGGHRHPRDHRQRGPALPGARLQHLV